MDVVWATIIVFPAASFIWRVVDFSDKAAKEKKYNTLIGFYRWGQRKEYVIFSVLC